MNINIKIDEEQLAGIIAIDLEDAMDYFKRALYEPQPNIFSTDAVTDKIMIIERINAFQLVLDWYK